MVLILISAVLAYIFPLELFIVSYAFIGPLHYITEINWLHKKKYFFSNNQLVWLVIGITTSFILFLPKIFFYIFGVEGAAGAVMSYINEWSNSMIFISLVLAVGYHLARTFWAWFLVTAVAIAGAYYLNFIELYSLVVGVFVPTIIHVYIFTMIFMLYGSLNSKSKWGYITVAMVVMVPLLIVYLPLERGSYVFLDFFKNVYLENDLHVTPVLFSKFLGISDGTTFFFYETMELKLMMFLAFIYTYHYLNWFSKTTTIKWHHSIDKKKMVYILLLWLGVASIYFYDFTLGLLISLFMGFLHVILEFPLNVWSIKQLFK